MPKGEKSTLEAYLCGTNLTHTGFNSYELLHNSPMNCGLFLYETLFVNGSISPQSAVSSALCVTVSSADLYLTDQLSVSHRQDADRLVCHHLGPLFSCCIR